MPSIKGTKFRIRVSTVAGTNPAAWTNVGGIKNVDFPIDAASIDDSEFGVLWMKRLQGLLDIKASLAGSRRPTDAGQNMIRTAMLTDGDLYVALLPDGATTVGIGLVFKAVVSKFGQATAVDDKLNLAIELEGDGEAQADTGP
jgi:hypothetical protein